MQPEQPLKIIRLIAENVKKLRAIQITPEGHIVQISGPNAAGKTSVLDCIWYALGGGSSLPEEPIRRGAAKAEIHIDLGEMIVTRTFTHKGSYLKVLSKDGLEWKSPQKVLDKLLGKLSFDPLAFAKLQEDAAKDAGFAVMASEVRSLAQRLTNFSVMRSLSPMARYFSRSLSFSAKLGGSVHTPSA